MNANLKNILVKMEQHNIKVTKTFFKGRDKMCYTCINCDMKKKQCVSNKQPRLGKKCFQYIEDIVRGS